MVKKNLTVILNKDIAEQLSRTICIVGNFAANGNSLLNDSTNNLSEMYICNYAKFVAGKQTFYGQRNFGCYGAGISFNKGPEW